MPRPSSVPQAGYHAPSLPGWAARPTAPSRPRGSPLPGRHPLPLIRPGWAETPASDWAAIHPGRFSQAGIPSPGRDSLCRLGWLLRIILAGLGLKAEIYLLRDFLLIWHRLHRIVPVLGRL
jgi:hypothetical protein